MKAIARLFLPVQLLAVLLVFALFGDVSRVGATTLPAEVSAPWRQFTAGIEDSPLILSNADPADNSLQGSVYELLNRAQDSILLMSFTFSDPEVINIVNKKASEGCFIQVIVDRDHCNGLQRLLHPEVQVDTRVTGDGHMHHKILVVDEEYVWVSSANFTSSSLAHSCNLAVGFRSSEAAECVHQEALSLVGLLPRTESAPVTSEYGEQRLDLYLLPHNNPKIPSLVETQMNDLGEQKLIELINSARHHLRISMDVWTLKDVSRAVMNADRRGVHVNVVVGDRSTEAVQMLMNSGIDVQIGRNLHHKFMLIDQDVLLNGSPNWSVNAFSRSDESFVVLYDLSINQLQALESSLDVAGLPVAMYVNEQADEDDGVLSAEVLVKLALVDRTLDRLEQEIEQEPVSQEHLRCITIARRLFNDLVQYRQLLEAKPVPGVCFYEGSDYLTNVVDIAEKQERVLDAVRYIETSNDVDQEVVDYFYRILDKLTKGINVPLPDYFHATRSGLEAILTSRTILQSIGGATGPGVYLSNNNEGNYGYGSHAFAVDKSCLVDTQAVFRTGRHPVTNVFFSLWASVHKDIPIEENTIAFIDTSSDDVDYVRALLAEQELDIEVLERGCAEEVLRIFNLTTRRRELPSFYWRKARADDYLPQNTYPRSAQGTFRPFLFSLDALLAA